MKRQQNNNEIASNRFLSLKNYNTEYYQDQCAWQRTTNNPYFHHNLVS